MPEPVKDQIAEAVKTALQGATLGAGYRTDIGLRVSRRRTLANELTQVELPRAAVWCGDAEPSPATCMGSYRERVQVVVETYYRSEEREDLDRDGIRCEADVKQSVLSNTALKDLVHQVAPGAVAADHQEFADDRIGRRLVAFDVDYNWTATSP